jgi:mRNA-degrading endonuclease RelE of RelBE toxin-antitoxin system
VKSTLKNIAKLNLDQLDVQRLCGMGDVYRVRKGKMRIIFRMKGDRVKLLAVERRSETTYKNL